MLEKEEELRGDWGKDWEIGNLDETETDRQNRYEHTSSYFLSNHAEETGDVCSNCCVDTVWATHTHTATLS